MFKNLFPLVALIVLVLIINNIKTVDTFSSFTGPKYQSTWTLKNEVGLPNTKWCDKTAAPCERNAKSCTPCSGGLEGKCLDNGCGLGGGWQNSISRDCTGDWAPHRPDGTWRVYKKGNYYGWGVCGGNSYGEPYYSRSVKY